MPHGRRPDHEPRHPVQVTMRASNSPNLRSAAIFAVVRRSIARAHKPRFHVIHFSVQQDHLHFIVEADDRIALRNGVRGLAIRIALAVNRVAKRRGSLFIDRFHARTLSSPREVRASVVYVLQNFRKHLRAPCGVDPCSSGPWFDGWIKPPEPRRDPCPVVPARSWLASTGWRRRGLIDIGESPGGGRDRGPTPRS